MLRLSGGQVESLFDEPLPIEVRELPDDLTALDVLLPAAGRPRRPPRQERTGAHT